MEKLEQEKGYFSILQLEEGSLHCEGLGSKKETNFKW